MKRTLLLISVTAILALAALAVSPTKTPTPAPSKSSTPTSSSDAANCSTNPTTGAKLDLNSFGKCEVPHSNRTASLPSPNTNASH